MNYLTYFKRFAFTVIIAFVGVNLWGQGLSGSGTSIDPYQISSAGDWAIFTNPNDSATYWASGVEVKLTTNIPTAEDIAAGTSAVTTMVGVWSNNVNDRRPYRGKFFGDGKTITVAYSNTANDGSYTAPFVCTNGATINKLNISGTIESNYNYAAGIIGGNYGNTTKINGGNRVNVNITGGHEYYAGVVVNGEKVEISSCVYAGQIVAGDNSAGFVAVGYANTKVINCLFDPATGSSITGAGIENFVANNIYNTQHSNGNYYTLQVGTSTQWTRVYKSWSETPSDQFYGMKWLNSYGYYYVPGVGAITGVNASYYQRNIQNEGLNFIVTFNGNVINADQYTSVITDSESQVVSDITTIATGDYTLTVTGNENDDYKGTLTQTFEVVADLFTGNGTSDSPYQIGTITDWNNLAVAVNGGESFSGIYFVLTSGITVSVDSGDKMVGAEGHPFSGTFDGDNKTLTFNSTTDTKENTAPFRYTQGATIKNLTVAGDIETENNGIAGLIGINTGTTTVTNVLIDVDLNKNDEYKEIYNVGGFAVNGVGINFDGCAFIGIIKGYGESGGFCAIGDETTNFSNCLFNPDTDGGAGYVYGANFSNRGIGNISDSYYTYADTEYSLVQGTKAYLGESSKYITQRINYTCNNHSEYIYKYIDVEFVGLQETYSYTGGNIYDDIVYTVTFDGNVVNLGEAYTAKINNSPVPTVVQEMGTYTLTITGVHDNGTDADYYGSISTEFSVGISGEGTKDKPYILRSSADWNMFADVSHHEQFWASGVYALLSTSINVSTMVGTTEHPYCGSFDGFDYTLTLDYTENTPENAAPFRYTNGATIKDLTVGGNITTEHNGAAGLIGINNERKTTVQNVGVVVNISASGQENCGGFAVDGSGVEFKNCVYKGIIIAGNNSGGFCGIGSSETTFTNCLFVPVIGDNGSSIAGGENFANGGCGYIDNSYYTMQVGSSEQGYLAYASIENDKIGHVVKVLHTKVYNSIISVSIEGLSLSYPYTGEVINIDYTISFDPADVLTSSDYEVALMRADQIVNEVREIGGYILSVNGVESNGYEGSAIKTFVVGFEGVGTSDNPYIIDSEDDWAVFVSTVNGGYSYSGEFIKLADNITIDTKAGWWDMSAPNDRKAFSGTFDGNWHTITFNCGSNSPAGANSEYACAPFCCIEGATIKNLKVEGTIISKSKFAAGIAGVAYGTNNITNCTSSVTLNCTYKTNSQSDCTFGGLVGQMFTGVISFENCMFDGTIIDNRSPKAAQKCAGFVGWVTNGDNYAANYTNCTMAGTISILKNTSTFHRNNAASSNLDDRCYYLVNYNSGDKPGPAGTIAPTDVASGYIAKKYNVSSTDRYVSSVLVSDYMSVYQYTGSVIDVEPTVSYFGTKLIKDEDYTVAIMWYDNDSWTNVTSTGIIAAGDYKLVFSGKNTSDFYGSCEIETRVVNIDTWNGLKEALASAGGTITLTKDYIENGADVLLISGDIELNLNGHTLNRGLTSPVMDGTGQVIRIAAGANLTINGPGTITGGYSKAINATDGGEFNDGGGIFNWGNLTLNNVTVTGNKCIKFVEGSKHFTARGGGVYNGPGSSFTMNGGSLKGNESRGGGGGVHGNKTVSFNMTDVDVSNNVCEDKGGGIRVTGTTANITNCEIRNNQLITKDVSNGGGVFMESGTLNLTNCNIIANQSTKQGGGFYAVAGTTIATNCSFNDNFSYDYDYSGNENYGGGICLYHDEKHHSDFTLDGGSVDANQCRDNGGGIYVFAGATLRLKGNVKIFGNHKTTIGGKGTRDSSVDNNLYIADNTASGVVIIEGNLGDSFIGVMKKHNGDSSDDGIFTSGLGNITIGSKGNGTLANFVGDEEHYHVLPYGSEAKLGEPTVLESPDEPTALVIEVPTVVNTPVENVTSITFIKDGCLHVEGNGYIETNITNADPDRLVIENSGQFVTGSSDVKATLRKEIHQAYATSEEYWYLISSDIENPDILSATNLITANSTGFPTYDLYRLNEAKEELQWENYRNTAYSSGANAFNTIENCRGYLYRNYQDYTIIINGDLNTAASYTYDLSYTGTFGEVGNEVNNSLKGFNLIGNPYSHNITKGASNANILNGDLLENKYLVLNTDGTWTVTDDGTAIPPMTGIVVQAKKAGTMTITNSTSGSGGTKYTDDNIWFTVKNSEFSDVACVEFKEGHGLNKISHPNENAPMLYIRHNGENFASVDMNRNTREINLNFKAMTMGRYTLSLKPQGDFSYIHLIDKLTGEDVDMLEDEEYTFIGATSDAADRFIVRLSEIKGSNDENEVFAYQNGNNIVVSGEGELQVFDIMGRKVATQYIDGAGTWSAASVQTGVYILRLNGKTQKIVVK